MQKVKSPPVNLDKYLEGDKKRYLTYEDAARRYSMPYWTLVNLAQEAGATWALRKTAMVDIDMSCNVWVRESVVRKIMQ